MVDAGIDCDELEKLLDEIPHARASALQRHAHSDWQGDLERKRSHRREKLDRVNDKDSPVRGNPNVGGCEGGLQMLSNTFEELGISEFSGVAAESKANDLDDGIHSLVGNSNALSDEPMSLRPRCSSNASGDSSNDCCREVESYMSSRLNPQYDIWSRNRDLGEPSLFNRFISPVNNLAGYGSYLQSPEDGRGLYPSQNLGVKIPLSHMPFRMEDPLHCENGLIAGNYGGNTVKLGFENLHESVTTGWDSPYHLSMMRSYIPKGRENKKEGMPDNLDNERNHSERFNIFAQNGKNGHNACSNLNFLGYLVDESFELSAVNPVSHSFPWSISSNHKFLSQIQGRIKDVAKNQQGCRCLQRIVWQGAPQEVMIIFSEIVGHSVELMKDPFGNYLMQKLIGVCTESQRTHIIRVVTANPKDLANISVDPHGTRVVQRLVETLKLPCQVSMVISSLEPWAVNLMVDLNGNHVVQRCLQCLDVEDNKFLLYAAAKYCVEIAAHQHGCCVLQRCLDHATGIYHQFLVAEIAANALILSQDAFGNYVVQYVLRLKIQWAIDCIVCQLQGNYASLSMQKYGSNVVESCLREGGDNVHSVIVHELVSSVSFEQLPQDPFGNYVIQSALAESKGPIRSILVEAIRPLALALGSNLYGKKIVSLIHSRK